MDQAFAFIRERIPPSDLLFVDNQTGILLGHYLCRQQPFFISVWTVGFKTLHCGGYRVAATDGKVFVFRATNFFPSWNEMVRTYDLKPGDSVWVLQEGWRWENCLARQLQFQYPEFRDLKAYSFGHNITIFQLKVGQPMPMAAQPLSYTTQHTTPNITERGILCLPAGCCVSRGIRRTALPILKQAKAEYAKLQ